MCSRPVRKKHLGSLLDVCCLLFMIRVTQFSPLSETRTGHSFGVKEFVLFWQPVSNSNPGMRGTNSIVIGFEIRASDIQRATSNGT